MEAHSCHYIRTVLKRFPCRALPHAPPLSTGCRGDTRTVVSPAAAASYWPLQHAAQTVQSQGGESGCRSGRGRRRRRKRSHAAGPAAALQWCPGRLLRTSLRLTGASLRGDTEVRAARGYTLLAHGHGGAGAAADAVWVNHLLGCMTLKEIKEKNDAICTLTEDQRNWLSTQIFQGLEHTHCAHFTVTRCTGFGFTWAMSRKVSNRVSM